MNSDTDAEPKHAVAKCLADNRLIASFSTPQCCDWCDPKTGICRFAVPIQRHDRRRRVIGKKDRLTPELRQRRVAGSGGGRAGSGKIYRFYERSILLEAQGPFSIVDSDADETAIRTPRDEGVVAEPESTDDVNQPEPGSDVRILDEYERQFDEDAADLLANEPANHLQVEDGRSPEDATSDLMRVDDPVAALEFNELAGTEQPEFELQLPIATGDDVNVFEDGTSSLEDPFTVDEPGPIQMEWPSQAEIPEPELLHAIEDDAVFEEDEGFPHTNFLWEMP